MRDRAWRRDIEEKTVIKRLRRSGRRNTSYTWYFTDVNGLRVRRPKLKDYINTKTCNMFKTYTTDKYDTRFKSKYSPNKNINYYRFGKTREKSKLEFLSILKENGLK